MENTTIIATSRAVALERHMDIIANNVANMSTVGFKGNAPLFIEHLQRPSEGKAYSMVENRTVLRDLSPGPFTQTGNPLDVALEGDGYFTVDSLSGPRYTRSGRFSMNDNRELVTSTGMPVLDDTGNRITFPTNAREIRIDDNGTIFTERGPVGKIGVVRFEREQFMTQLGNGLYTTDEEPLPASSTLTRQGFIEGSNVQAVAAMTEMIEVNRQYQNLQNLLQNEHNRLVNAYAKLTKLT